MWAEEYLYSKGPIEGSVHLCMYLFWYKLLSLLGFVLQGRLKDVLSNRWMYYLALARPQPEQCSPTICSVFPLELDVCFSLLARFLLATGHTPTKGFLEMHCSLKSRVLNGRLQPAKISDFIHLCILVFFLVILYSAILLILKCFPQCNKNSQIFLTLPLIYF